MHVAFFSPFIPPEWFAAHGVAPAWMRLERGAASRQDVAARGICSCAASLVAKLRDGSGPEAIVLTTACDQMRYAAACVNARRDVPTFLFNLPSTWQSPQARQLYRDELERLGRFLVQIRGRQPSQAELVSILTRYDEHRVAALRMRADMSASDWAETLVQLRGGLAESWSPRAGAAVASGIPLALLGGPLLAEDFAFLERLERAGGRIAVDGSETGERTLPAPFDRRRLIQDPIGELARAYFDTIPDVFRRPNTRLYEWLGESLAARSLRGIVVRRYPFCDLWHAEVHRLRQWSDLPVLDIDVAGTGEGESSRAFGRIEAFLEMLR